MPTSKEQAEQDYMRARMGEASISEERSPADDRNTAAGASDGATNESKPELDDSISSEEVLALKEEGNNLYKAGDYAAAVEKYTKAASSAHAENDTRAVVLANRAAAHLKLQRFRETADDATEALKLRPGYIKALKRRKEARVALKEYRGACEDAKELKESGVEISRLERLATEREKKEREEAMESLKGLGNSILGNFGMSLDDIKMEQDPNTGSYSINFKS